jgi:hypothetical protein
MGSKEEVALVLHRWGCLRGATDIARAVIRILAVLLLMASLAWAGGTRSHSAIREFKAQNPCPSTGLNTGRCPGYIIDHVYPLCAGGPDASDNMQWQTLEEAKGKDQYEHHWCRRMRIRP